MAFNPENSFFLSDYTKLRVLIFVPHEDDEILVAGSLIYNLSKAGAKITIVYSTNGDWKYNAETRFREAEKAAQILGVPDDHIIFMGYGDSGSGYSSEHIFYNETIPTISPAGFSKTYGTNSHPDFAFSYRGEHSSYTAENFFKDVIDIIEQIQPNLIICSDYDEHPDHKMLSLTFDRAIGRIKRNYPGYSPEIWKTFAYAFYYSAIPDYLSINNPETKRPNPDVTEKYSDDLMDHFYYCWNDRYRMPVSTEARSCSLSDNVIAQALKKHKSQRIITRADRIINSDEVFFRRRTDSLTYLASLTASSGNPEFVRDYMLYNTDSLATGSISLCNYYWKPEEQDPKKSILFSWEEAVDIDSINLYGSCAKGSSIESILIKLSDGYETITGCLPETGLPLKINTGKHKKIVWCEISILKYTGNEYGISECEIFADANSSSVIKPFCKITIEDNFVYEYYCTEDICELSLGLYNFCVSKDDIYLKVVYGKSVIKENILYTNRDDEIIVIRAEDSEGEIYDQIVIKILPLAGFDKYQRFDKTNKRYIRREKRKLKFHNMYFILRHNGIFPVVKRAWINTIKPRIMGTKK